MKTEPASSLPPDACLVGTAESSLRRRKVRVLSLLVAGTVLLHGAVWWLQSRRRTSVNKGLVVETADLQLGEVWEQSHYQHVLTLRNPTDEPVEVFRLSPSCRCVEVTPPRSPCRPAGVGRFRWRWICCGCLRPVHVERKQTSTNLSHQFSQTVSLSRGPCGVRFVRRSSLSRIPFFSTAGTPSP